MVVVSATVADRTFTGVESTAPLFISDEGLEGWYDPAPLRSDFVARSSADGEYEPIDLFTTGREIVFRGGHHATTDGEAQATAAWMAALVKQRTTFSVTDGLGTLSAGVILRNVRTRFPMPYRLEFEAVFRAADPRKYGPEVTQSGSSSSDTTSGGLLFPIFDVTGFAEFTETAGAYRKFLANTGTVASFPELTVAGPFEWFRFTLNGQVVEFVRDVPAGQSVRLDLASESAWIGGSDVSGFLTRDEFFSVPAGGAWLQFFADVSGVPFTVSSRSAWL